MQRMNPMPPIYIGQPEVPRCIGGKNVRCEVNDHMANNNEAYPEESLLAPCVACTLMHPVFGNLPQAYVLPVSLIITCNTQSYAN
jgi:hypothetical protein